VYQGGAWIGEHTAGATFALPLASAR
jgi:hypothetical protein